MDWSVNHNTLHKKEIFRSCTSRDIWTFQYWDFYEMNNSTNSIPPDESVGWRCWKTRKLSDSPEESSWGEGGGGQSRAGEEGGGAGRHHQRGDRRAWSPCGPTQWAHCGRTGLRRAGCCWSNVSSSSHCICWQPGPVWPPWPPGERAQGRSRRRQWRSKTCLEERRSRDSEPRLKYKLLVKLFEALFNFTGVSC